MFEGFQLDQVDVGEVALRVRHGGHGPAVLLLHGHPRTHATWHRVAPQLARDYTVVRGGYVALRLALDHPEAVTRLGFLGLVPIGEALARADARFAASWWHWFFYAQPDQPERLINADPAAHYHLTGREAALGRENYEDIYAAVHNPATVHAMLEDYRAGLGIDRAHDDADKAAGRTVGCPVLVLWAAGDESDQGLYDDVLGVWRPWAPDLRGGPFGSGHHMAEEDPDELTRRLRAFLSGS